MYEVEDYNGAGLIILMIGAVSGAISTLCIIGLILLARWLI